MEIILALLTIIKGTLHIITIDLHVKSPQSNESLYQVVKGLKVFCFDFFGNTPKTKNTVKSVGGCFVRNCPWLDFGKNAILLKKCNFSNQDKNMNIQPQKTFCL